MSDETRQTANNTNGTEPAGPPMAHFGKERERIPERMGHFKILDLVAAGMALVYKAEQENPHRMVALKIPRGGKLLSEETRKRFLREVELAGRMDHAGIVPVFEAGEIDGVPYYTMPFIEGRSLAQHLEMERTDITPRLDLFARLCQVVQTLHAGGLVHRDLKPENVMIDRHGTIRLLDFGLAKALAESEAFTGDQSLLGTLQCMAPEQTLPGKQGKITPAADVYSLGMIFYWLLTDAFPYSSKGDRDEVLRTIRECKPAPPSQRNPVVPETLDRVVLACLAKEPEGRPQSAGELETMIRAVMSGNTPSTDGASDAPHRVLPLLLIGLGLLVVIVTLVLTFWPRHPMPILREPAPSVIEERRLDVSSHAVETKNRVDVYDPAELAAMASGNPAPGTGTPVPKELWPVYEKTLTALSEDAALRRCGAVLIGAAGNDAVHLSWHAEDSAEELTRSVEPHGAATLYLQADRHYVVEAIVNGNVLRKTVSVSQGEIRYLMFP